ncbi:hypothetical protein GGR54DRAFT_170097 [Hypoxylon sp. NC1633]|nr:hypothetical protein GGR54DRAFT_170097 [Hypoxylon sp. NC1633]
MSGDHPISSFGDPNAQPPTPKQTPTSAGFPGSVFETPKNNRASFEESSGWTPRFADEYSVFNSTPGNLRASQGSFVDFSVSTPYESLNHKRPLSTEHIAAEIATHVTHFSSTPNLPLPPVDPSRRLLSSPDALVTGQSPTEPGFGSQQQQQQPKKICRDVAQESKIQTATPPPSTQKGKRRLAPKLQTGTMQNDGFDPEFLASTPQQQHMTHFVSTPTDIFGYPMSAPAASSNFGDSRMFWDTDMSGMDFDFSTGNGNVLQTPSHRPMNSLDWGKSNEIFQETGTAPPQSQESNPPAKKERVLAPKPPAANPDTNATDSSMFVSSFHAPTDESFAMMSQNGGVDPGLLFTRPPSSSMEPAHFDPMAQLPLQSFTQPEPVILTAAKPPKRAAVRRSNSTKEVRKKGNRATASSPIKPSDRPGLSRSFSENIGRNPVRATSNLPNLAPATRPMAQSSGRAVSQGSRPNGRISPLKGHHRRLPSLSSIPETPTPRTHTSVKFTIDSSGRARAETTTVVVDDDDLTPTVIRHQQEPRGKGKSWASSEDEGSSTDDEPIIIPSRNTSFALPEPRRPSSYSIHSSQRSVSDHSTSSLGIFYNELNPADDDPESEAETILNVMDGSSRGDAASELRKVVESRQKRTSSTNRNSVPRMTYRANSTTTPASLKTTANLRTPSTDRSSQIRCICNTASSHMNSNNYMVQCESCEMWLHGKCINITRQTLPRVYICAFCANTPNAHGMRGREIRRSMGGPNPRAAITSPLAHKSFKSFR